MKAPVRVAVTGAAGQIGYASAVVVIFFVIIIMLSLLLLYARQKSKWNA